ncbi:hypothetical protein [Kordiimonas marina]|uniref:hypothetical protein n=1 Tax=Kordiimonas marina TaxID=2872312 RepID=UPI001FF0E1FB|nr:hypothetical protein [Kordiimonas marina]MCJ9430478.1 hypothetical protein [Kordiimonas marina]
MIIATVQFELAEPLSPEAAETLFHANSRLYEGRQDLLRKSYIRSLDGRTVGAVYFWRSLEDATNFYSDTWHAHVRRKYGVAPTIRFFQSLLVVNNEALAPAEPERMNP